MRGLTPAERAVLEIVADPGYGQSQKRQVTPDEDRAARSLKAAGRLAWEIFGPNEARCVITPLGRLALECDRLARAAGAP